MTAVHDGFGVARVSRGILLSRPSGSFDQISHQSDRGKVANTIRQKGQDRLSVGVHRSPDGQRHATVHREVLGKSCLLRAAHRETEAGDPVTASMVPLGKRVPSDGTCGARSSVTDRRIETRHGRVGLTCCRALAERSQSLNLACRR